MKITSIDKLYGFLRTIPKCEQVRVSNEATMYIVEFGACYVNEETFEVTPF